MITSIPFLEIGKKKRIPDKNLTFLVASKVVWSDFAAVLGDQNAKEIIAYFRFLIKSSYFLETIKTKPLYASRIRGPKIGGPWSGKNS